MIIITIIIIIIAFVFNHSPNKNKDFEQINFNKITQVVNQDENKKIDEKIKIHIVGEVNSPGLIELEEGSRVADAIELAGGITEQADVSKTNLASILSDGEKVYIPNINDEDIEIISTNEKSNKININTATISKLKEIPGVGESTANSIIEYRTKNRKIFKY